MAFRFTALANAREAVELLWSESDSFVKRHLALALAFVVGSAILAALAPIGLKLIVDAFPSGGRTEPSLAPALLIIAYVVSHYLARAFADLRVLVHSRGEQHLHRHLSRRLLTHIMQLPLRFHLDRKSGAIGQTLTSGLLGYQIVLQHATYTILPVCVEFFTIAVVLIHLDHPAYLSIVTLSAFAYITTFGFGAASVAEPARAVSSAHIDAHAVLTDSLLNYETVKYFNAEAAVSGRYDGVLRQTESHWARFYRTRALNSLAVTAIAAVSLGTALAYAAYEVAHGAITVGDFVLINTYMLQIVRPLEMLGYAMRDISQGVSFLQKMLALFHESPEADRAVGPVQFSQRGRGLAFDRVTFSYRPGRIVLRCVSFSVAPGHTIAVVGVSGSGKSSLVRLLFRLYEPERGQILIDDTPISEMPLSCLRRMIAVVPQDTVLFNDTIGNNIGLGRPGSTQAEIEHAARLAHLHAFIMSLPDGYDTVVGERGLKLSGGERQRVAIARAALKQPRIFVFDEATSSLDSRTEREILRNLIDVSKTSTTLIIAHRLSTVVHADEIIVLDDGRIIERGAHIDLLTHNGSYAALWRAQQESAPVGNVQAMSLLEQC